MVAFRPVTSSEDTMLKLGALSNSPSAPATSANSVSTGPGQSAVTATPGPLSSACSASDQFSMNALVAA